MTAEVQKNYVDTAKMAKLICGNIFTGNSAKGSYGRRLYEEV
jgi:hypothetical protein